MAKKPGQFKIYFEDNGDMMYREPWWELKNPNPAVPLPKSEDNHAFHDQMEYVRCYGSVITFKSLISGRSYHMFLRHFDEMMQAKRMVNNVIEGDFTFTKHGLVQGFRMVLPKPPAP